ncbi:MAG: lycopene cyclase domain-containing protein [Leifsonia sp.]
MTYLVLSLVFLAVAVIVLAVSMAIVSAPDRTALVRRWWPAVLLSGLAMFVLTAVFDNLMIVAGVMTYSRSAVSGVRLGPMPVEDLAYPFAALLLLPALWLLFRPRDAR